MTGRRLGALVVVLTAVAALVGACSLPTDRSPRAIDRSRLPELLQPDRSTTTSAPASNAPTAQLWLVSDSEVSPVERKVKNLTPAVLVEAIRAPVSDKDNKAGLLSYVPPDTRVLSSDLQDHVLTVNLSDQMKGVGTPNDKLAYKQMVYTFIKSMRAADVRRVAFKIDGKSIKVPTDTAASGSVGLSDYNQTPVTTTLPRVTSGSQTAVPTPPASG